MDFSSLYIPTRVVFGEHTIDQLGDQAHDVGATHALVVTDPGVAAAGHEDRAVRALKRAGLQATVFEGVHENPTSRDVEACRDAADDARVDCFVGLGGGSSIDTARGANFLLTNGGAMKDYWGFGKASKPMLPLITVPTTTGTGSEMQSFALIADPETHQKMACGDHKARSAVAILDPHLAKTQPRQVIACTGLDCIAHALETAVTRKRTSFSLMFSREAWRLAATNFRRILDHADDIEAQGAMLRAACFAGLAIEHSMLGAAHSAANPLTAQFNLVHGHAVGLMLPHVMRFNAQDPDACAQYAAVARAADTSLNGAPDVTVVDDLLENVEQALAATGLPRTLGDAGVPSDAIYDLAQGASRQWTAQFNPREATATDFAALYAAGMS